MLIKGWRTSAGMLLALLAGTVAFAASQLVATEGLEPHLVDEQGRAVYLSVNDEPGVSHCDEACATEWPPVLVAPESELSAGAGVAAAFIGTVSREDGTLQATYNGMPLYYSSLDSATGETSGHGAGAVWFLVSPYGVAIAAPEAPVASSDEDVEVAGSEEMLATGGEIYSSHCAACHGNAGTGASGPALAGARRLDDSVRTVRQITHGSSHMPGFGTVLDDLQIASVASYIRNTWGNDFGFVTSDMVNEQR